MFKYGNMMPSKSSLNKIQGGGVTLHQVTGEHGPWILDMGSEDLLKFFSQCQKKELCKAHRYLFTYP